MARLLTLAPAPGFMRSPSVSCWALETILLLEIVRRASKD
jgi:hypothetical protein